MCNGTPISHILISTCDYAHCPAQITPVRDSTDGIVQGQAEKQRGGLRVRPAAARQRGSA